MLLKNNRQLKHINLAFCQANMDETAITISQYNHDIRSIDMWKSRNLSSIGLLALATTCTELEEVDFGWWWVAFRRFLYFFSTWAHKIKSHKGPIQRKLETILQRLPNKSCPFSSTVYVMKPRPVKHLGSSSRIVQTWRSYFWLRSVAWTIETWRTLQNIVRIWSSWIYSVSWAYQRINVFCKLIFFDFHLKLWHLLIFGSFDINVHFIEFNRILTQCKRLKLMDLSFCVHLDDAEVGL